jgi:NAD(P)-dependent dehydrogenase (short-subunit alcohol dehydrogenase family)
MGAFAVVGEGPGWELAVALAAQGNDAVFVGQPDAPAAAGTAGTAVHCAPAWDRSDAAGFASSLAGGPGVGAVVWAWAPPSATTPSPFDSVDEGTWEQACELPIRQYLSFLQGAHRYFAGRPGSLVLLVPTISLLGPPPGLVAWVTAAEGQRTLMKSAARNWGPAGLRSYAVAVTPALLVAPGSGAPTAPRLRVGLPPSSFAHAPSMDDVARVVATVTGPGFAAVTGSTIGVDGGQWMVP